MHLTSGISNLNRYILKVVSATYDSINRDEKYLNQEWYQKSRANSSQSSKIHEVDVRAAIKRIIT